MKESEEAPFLYPVVDGNGHETMGLTNFRALGHFSLGTLVGDQAILDRLQSNPQKQAPSPVPMGK